MQYVLYNQTNAACFGQDFELWWNCVLKSYNYQKNTNAIMII